MPYKHVLFSCSSYIANHSICYQNRKGCAHLLLWYYEYMCYTHFIIRYCKKTLYMGNCMSSFNIIYALPHPFILNVHKEPLKSMFQTVNNIPWNYICNGHRVKRQSLSYKSRSYITIFHFCCATNLAMPIWCALSTINWGKQFDIKRCKWIRKRLTKTNFPIVHMLSIRHCARSLS